MICFDWFFPESVRSLVLNGADIVCHCANLVLPYCPDAMVTRCLENHVFAITANRIGYEERGNKKRLTYIGKSEIVSPDGKILFRASGKDEELTILDVDPLIARNKQVNAYNNIFSDRRPDLYNC
jgi:predicted amidohydrolase